MTQSAYTTFTTVLLCTLVLHANSALAKSLGDLPGGEDFKKGDAPKSFRVIEGHNIELTCEVEAQTTPPVVHWLHNGKHIVQGPLDNNANNVIGPAGDGGFFEGYYTEANVTIKAASQADAGKYTCVGDTDTERVTKSYTLEVIPSNNEEERKRNQDEDCNVDIYQFTNQVYRDSGKPVYLVCRATQRSNDNCADLPTPTIRWQFGTEDIDEDTPGFQLEQNGDMIIKRVGEEHGAAITCTATGSDGSVDRRTPYIYAMDSS